MGRGARGSRRGCLLVARGVRHLGQLVWRQPCEDTAVLTGSAAALSEDTACPTRRGNRPCAVQAGRAASPAAHRPRLRSRTRTLMTRPRAHDVPVDDVPAHETPPAHDDDDAPAAWPPRAFDSAAAGSLAWMVVMIHVGHAGSLPCRHWNPSSEECKC